MNDREMKSDVHELTRKEMKAIFASWWGHQGQIPSRFQDGTPNSGTFTRPVLQAQTSPNFGVD